MTCGALPENFSEKDTLRLLGAHCPAMKLDGMRLLDESTIVISDGLLEACAAKFVEAASPAVDQAVASGKLAAAPMAAGSSAGGKAGMDDWSDDEGEDSDKRGKGKGKNKSARALLKQQASESKFKKGSKKTRKDGTGSRNGADGDSSNAGTKPAGAAALTPSIQTMAKDMQMWYKEHEMSREVAEGVAEVIRPELIRAYIEAHRSAFAAMAESRKKKQLAFESVLQQTIDNFALFSKGAATVGEPSARAQLAQHLLREHGIDIVSSEFSISLCYLSQPG